MNNQPIKFIDLFAGIGGFHYGLIRVNTTRPKQPTSSGSTNAKDETIGDQKPAIGGSSPETPGLATGQETATILGEHDANDSGEHGRYRAFTCVYANEWDQYASSIYKKHYEKCDTSDITTINAEDIPDHELLVRGFPCQSFSVAGKRAGFNETRGTLFFEIARILKQKRSRYFLLENVKGLLSHDSGKTFQTILGVLTDLGYDVQWQVLNSRAFGVPQNRERTYIVGNLRGQPRPKILSIEYDSIQTVKELTTGVSQSQRVYNPNGLATTVSALAGGMGAKTGLYAMRGRYNKDGKVEQQLEFRGDITNTLTGVRKDNLYLESEIAIRRLTPTECERLQGFPDDYTKFGVNGELISDTQRYKMLGNAVTTNVVTAIGKMIFQAINESY